ncbi:hypothetical protein LEP1GSC005_1851 [Leptospira santarosai str. ST188]|uniref:GTPase domain-containing protein n=1 Tax=Leptospira santarosai TaxID=28183 RepID=UPI0002BC5C6D|nr:GTPase domain-containing protein [Leptospira santarosai]EMF91267.1 hypothetical protein LEP1GSC005_1851 [Leptospira santarosai str. ST188]
MTSQEKNAELKKPEEDIDSDAFFKEIREKHSELKFENKIITLTVWGWVGDGKTVSILTAKQYLDLMMHGVSLGEIVDSRDLKELEKTDEKIENQRVSDLAKNTLSFIRDYSKEFIENCEWPKGTNKHIPFLFRIDTFTSLNAYLYIPDIPGGNFQDADDLSNHFLNGSNGIIVLVDPKRYCENSYESKKYISEVRFRIKAAAEKGLPTVVFINKADDFSGISTEIVDKVHTELTVYRSMLAGKNYRILRSSVIGHGLTTIGENDNINKNGSSVFLPDSNKRNPLNILKGWVWLIYNGFEHSLSTNGSTPSLHYRNSLVSINAGIMNIPDIRHITNYKNVNAYPICIAGDLGDELEIFFLTEDGELLSGKLINSSELKMTTVGKIMEFEDDLAELKCSVRDGFIVIGKRKNATYLFSGILGGNLTKSDLEHPVYCWELSGNETLVTSYENGNLSLLRLEDKKWISKDYITEFLPNPSKIKLKYDYKNHLLYAHNGNLSAGIRLTENKFGDRFDFKVVPQYDAESANVSIGISFTLVSQADKKLVVFNKDEKYPIARANHPELSLINEMKQYAVVITTDNFIRTIYTDSEQGFKISDDHLSKQLEAKPDTVLLGEQSNSIFAYYKESGILMHYKLFGI